MLLIKYYDIYVGDIDWLTSLEEFTNILTEFKIKTIYLVNQNLDIASVYQDMYPNFNVLIFRGGFMLDSIVLFPLNKPEDRNYLSQILNLAF